MVNLYLSHHPRSFVYVMSADSQIRMWESMRADARHQDNNIEKILSELENIVQNHAGGNLTSSASGGSSGVSGAAISPQVIHKFDATLKQANEAVLKMQAYVGSMNDIIKRLSASGEATSQLMSMNQFTQRFDDLCAEKNQVIRHLTREFTKKREHAELLNKVHTTITIHKESEEMRHLAGERDSINYTRRKVAGLLDTAATNRERLESQRQRFLAISDNLVTILERVPFINNILKKIDAKRRRNAVILAFVIAVCLVLTILFY